MSLKTLTKQKSFQVPAGRRERAKLCNPKKRQSYQTGRKRIRSILLERISKPLHKALKPEIPGLSNNLIAWEKTTEDIAIVLIP